jgi:nicotinamidase/pyrazinamidase
MRIFYDVDTQHDFMDRKGALYVPGAEEIKPNLEKLTDYAKMNRIITAGSMDKHFGTPEYKHREAELKIWGGDFPDHCMNKTRGQRKIRETKKKNQYYEPHRLNNKFNPDDLRWYQVEIKHPLIVGDTAILFEKQSFDVFTNPSFAVFLSMTQVKEAVVYGVATDYCVKAAVLGMQKRGIQCYVVEDAIAAVAPDTGRSALEEMLYAGAKMITTQDVLENRII